MADPKLIKVCAKRRGQKPDGTWAREGDVFEIEASKVSKLWMQEIKPEPKAKPAPKAE